MWLRQEAAATLRGNPRDCVLSVQIWRARVPTPLRKDNKDMKFNCARLTVHVFVLLITCATTLLAQTETASGSWQIVPTPNGAKCKMPYPLCLTPEEGNVLHATAALSYPHQWPAGPEPHQPPVLTATS